MAGNIKGSQILLKKLRKIDFPLMSIINAVSPKPVKMREFSSTLAQCLQRPNLLPVPGATLKLILGDGAQLLLEGQKIKSIKLNNFFKFKYPLLQEALSSLTKK